MCADLFKKEEVVSFSIHVCPYGSKYLKNQEKRMGSHCILIDCKADVPPVL